MYSSLRFAPRSDLRRSCPEPTPHIHTHAPATASRPILAAVPQLSQDQTVVLVSTHWRQPHFVTHRSTAAPPNRDVYGRRRAVRGIGAADGSSASACRPSLSPWPPATLSKLQLPQRQDCSIQESRSSPVSPKPPTAAPTVPRQDDDNCWRSAGPGAPHLRPRRPWRSTLCRHCLASRLACCLNGTGLTPLESHRQPPYSPPAPRTHASRPRPPPRYAGVHVGRKRPAPYPGTLFLPVLPGLMAVTGPDWAVGRELSGQWLLC